MLKDTSPIQMFAKYKVLQMKFIKIKTTERIKGIENRKEKRL